MGISTNFRILVVDDDAQLRELIARSMRRAGNFVVTAEDAEVALAQTELGRAPFDVVVTDVHMPHMSGIELAAILLERRPTQRIVIMTGDPDEAMARDAISRGPVTYLLKPFELFELQSAVNQALATPRYAPSTPVDARNRPDPTIGTVPAEWLLWVDDRSYAGVGHGDRVARTARVLALGMTPPFTARPLAELEVAAWSHEIGLLGGPTANPIEMAWRSAQMLQECGGTEGVVTAVRHMHERWDGTGGPDRLREYQVPGSSQVLAAADAIDHYCAAWIQTGMDPAQAAERAAGLVAGQQGTCFNPEIARAIAQGKEAIRSICGVTRRAPLTNTAHHPIRSLPFDVAPRDVASVMY
ncbi:MAG TPA: response regulator [Longimicrobiales bacterium]